MHLGFENQAFETLGSSDLTSGLTSGPTSVPTGPLYAESRLWPPPWPHLCPYWSTLHWISILASPKCCNA